MNIGRIATPLRVEARDHGQTIRLPAGMGRTREVIAGCRAPS